MFGPGIVVFESVIMLSCRLLVVVVVVLFHCFVALVVLEYCVWSSDCSV